MITIIGGAFAILLLIYLALGLRVYPEMQRVVVFRLGKYTRTIGPGLCWHAPLLENTQKVDIQIKELEITKKFKDNKIKLSVFYKIENPKDFITQAQEPVQLLNKLTQSLLRKNSTDSKLEEKLEKKLNHEMKKYGFLITSVNISEGDVDVKQKIDEDEEFLLEE